MMRRRRSGLLVATIAYLVGALLVGLWPTPVDAELRQQIREFFAVLHRGGVPSSVGYGLLEFTANVAFFVPIGLLLCLVLTRRRWYLAIVGGALLSGLIELSQLLFLPARFASWVDIAANTLGTVIGVAAVLLARGIRRARRPTVS